MRTFSTTSGRQVFVLSAALAFLSHATIAVSQNIDSHVDHSELNTQDHAENVEQPAAPQETHTDHSQHTAPLQDAATTQIDHSAHQPAIQQESLFMEEAVSNLRDPHTYSGGFTRSSGVYALPLEEQLSLADEANFQRLMVNRLENIDTNNNNATRYDIQAWYGKTYNRFVLKAEGEAENNSLTDNRTELLWSRATSKFWDTQFGVRVDSGDDPSRSWLAFGVQGLAPYWFEVHATAFLGESGRSAFGFEAEYDARVTQRLVLKPRIDANIYGKDDPSRGIGSGFSDATLGLRAQYQITRQFAPYIGIERYQKFGKTADFLPEEIKARDTRWIAGLRFWF